jgi:hypothetical protein
MLDAGVATGEPVRVSQGGPQLGGLTAGQVPLEKLAITASGVIMAAWMRDRPSRTPLNRGAG